MVVLNNTTRQDVHGLMYNQLHDMIHDYAFSTKSRTEIFYKFNDASQDILANIWTNPQNNFNGQINFNGGGNGNEPTLVLSPLSHRVGPVYEVGPVGPVDLFDAFKEKEGIIENAHRPHVNDLYKYLYSWFVAHLYNDETVDFDLEPNLDVFMAMTGSINDEKTYADKMHDYFVEKCFEAFKAEYEKTKNNFITFYENISKTDSTTVTGEKTLVKYFYSSDIVKQSGGLKVPPKKHINLLYVIADTYKEKFIPHYTKTYNHFLKAQQDVMDMVLSREDTRPDNFDYDIALFHQAADIIMLNHPNEHIQTANAETLLQHIATPRQSRYIIDNTMLSNENDQSKRQRGKAYFDNNIICCQSTLDDGITDFHSHYCAKEPLTKVMENPTNNNMNVTIKCDNGLYIQYERNRVNWRVTWQSQNNNFTATLGRSNNSLEAKERFVAAITDMVTRWTTDIQTQPVQEKRYALSRVLYTHIIFKSLGDILQELNAVLKDGGYNNANDVYKQGYDVIGYDNENNAKRLIVSNDRPSATRILWYLYNGRNLGRKCNNESSNWTPWINQRASGGFLTTGSNPSIFIYDPSRKILPNRKKIFRNVNSHFPLIECTKKDLNIGKIISSKVHTYDANGNARFSSIGKNLYTLYQAFYIYYAIDDHTKNKEIFLNSLRFTGSHYSPIMINIINEVLLNKSMDVHHGGALINDIPYPDGSEYGSCDTNRTAGSNYTARQNFGFTSIDTIQTGSYFHYVTGDNFHMHSSNDGILTTIKTQIDVKADEYKNICKISGAYYYKDFFRYSTVGRDGSAITLPALNGQQTNLSVQVLNSETYCFPADKPIKYTDPYSLIVYFENDDNIVTTTDDSVNNKIIPKLKCIEAKEVQKNTIVEEKEDITDDDKAIQLTQKQTNNALLEYDIGNYGTNVEKISKWFKKDENQNVTVGVVLDDILDIEDIDNRHRFVEKAKEAKENIAQSTSPTGRPQRRSDKGKQRKGTLTPTNPTPTNPDPTNPVSTNRKRGLIQTPKGTANFFPVQKKSDMDVDDESGSSSDDGSGPLSDDESGSSSDDGSGPSSPRDKRARKVDDNSPKIYFKVLYRAISNGVDDKDSKDERRNFRLNFYKFLTDKVPNKDNEFNAYFLSEDSNVTISKTQFKTFINRQKQPYIINGKTLDDNEIDSLFSNPNPQTGGAQEESMNPLLYAVTSIGVLVLALTGLRT